MEETSSNLLVIQERKYTYGRMEIFYSLMGDEITTHGYNAQTSIECELL
jgi:hypothetical protein